MNYFKDIQCIEDLKIQYKKLAMIYHPDRGGDENIMKLINIEYDKLFFIYQNIHKKNDGSFFEKEAETTESIDFFKEVIDRLIGINEIIIEICGLWLWISGNTYPHRDKLKNLGFKFSKKRSMWYWHDESEKHTRWRKSGKMLSFDEIRALHGSEFVNQFASNLLS
jgi:curved DNA-binding protein CbpA